MRSVSTRFRAAAVLFILLVALSTSALYADESNPFEPPGARISPPPGAMSSTTDEPTLWETFVVWFEITAKIGPPTV